MSGILPACRGSLAGSWPATPADWTTAPTTVGAALDEIAARLTAANL